MSHLTEFEAIPIARQQLFLQECNFFGQVVFPSVLSGVELTPQDIEEAYPTRYEIWRLLNNYFSSNETTDEHTHEKLAKFLALLNNIRGYVEKHYRREVDILRPRQMSVFEDLQKAFEKNIHEMTVKVPTGMGKTVIFNQLVAAANVPTLIVVPTTLLVEQTYKRFKQFTPWVDIGRVYEAKKEYGRLVTITTYASIAHDHLSKLAHDSGTQLIIFDECQDVTSRKRIEFFENAPEYLNAVFIGFSATPIEITKKEFLNTRIGKMTRNLVHEISEKEAVAEGYLSPFSTVLVSVDVDITNVRVSKAGHYDETQLEERINTSVSNKAAVTLFLKIKEADAQVQAQSGRKIPLTTSVFVATIRHAQELAYEFQKAGISAAAVWGEQKEQKQILADWENGKIEVVCSSDLLVKGTDVSPIRLVLNVAPTGSILVEKQRSGRALRLDNNNPHKHAIIVDFIYRDNRSVKKQVLYPNLVGATSLEREIYSDSSERPQKSSPTIDLSEIKVEGLEVIVKVDEVQTFINEIEGVPRGYMLVDTKSLALEYGIGKTSVKSNLSNLLKTHGATGFRRRSYEGYYIPIGLYELLLQNLKEFSEKLKNNKRDNLSKSHKKRSKTKEQKDEEFEFTVPSDYIEVNFNYFINKFKLHRKTIADIVRRLARLHTVDLIYKKKQIFMPISLLAIIESYLSSPEFKNRSNSSKSYKQDNQPSNLSVENLNNWRKLSVSKLRIEYDRAHKTVTAIILQLVNEYPGLFFITYQSDGAPIYYSARDALAEQILEKRLRLHEYSIFDLAAEFNITPEIFNTEVYKIISTHRENIKFSKKGKILLSELGMEVIKELLTNNPEIFTRVRKIRHKYKAD